MQDLVKSPRSRVSWQLERPRRFLGLKFSTVLLQSNGSTFRDLPAAAIESGRWIAMSSSGSIRDGWAMNPASSFPSFRNRITYYAYFVSAQRRVLP